MAELGAVSAMRQVSCHAIPPLRASRGLSPAHIQAEEELVRPPTGGKYWWVQYRTTGLAAPRIIAAIARAAGCREEDISFPGPRPRDAEVVGWMSLPKELCDNPKQIMGAGYKRQLRILAVREGKRPVSAAEIKGLIWRLQIPGAGDYRAIRALVEHLRKFGGANYFGPSVTGPDEAWSRWGKAVAHGRPLPAAAREVGCDIRKALRAYRADCANALIEQRLQEAVLATVLPGDVVRTHCQQSPSKQGLELVPLDDDISAWQARVDAREVQAQVLVPGRWPAAWTGLTAAAGEAAATQDRAWHERQLQRLDEFDAEWRDARFMPTGIKGDIERGDAIISCRLPVWVHIESVLAELLQREVAG